MSQPAPIAAFSTDPGIAFHDPIDPESLPPGKPYFIAAAWGIILGVAGFITLSTVAKAPAVGITAGVLFAAGFVLLIIGASRHQKRAAARTARQLHDLDLRVVQINDRDLASSLFPPVAHLDTWLKYGSRGLNLYAETSVPTARGDIPVRIYSHKYTVNTNNSSQTIYHWVALTPAPDAWPSLTLTDENFFSKIGKAFGGADIQLDNDTFNNRWIVRSGSEDFAIVALSPDVQALLTEAPRSEAWVTGRGSLACIRGESLDPAKVRELAERAATVRATLPPELERFEQLT